MATYHEPTAISGGDYNDFNKRVKAWEWVNVITMFTATLKSIRLREYTAEEGYDVLVLSWAAEHALNGINTAERAAEKLFLDSTDADAYKQFVKSKIGRAHV